MSGGLLAGRRALVTGGGSGTGADMARAFAAAGAEVVIAGRRLEALQAVEGPGIRAIAADVTDEESVAALFAAAGPLDIVVANAGAAETAPFARTGLDLWERMLAVNLTGAFLTLREGARQMQARSGGPDGGPGWGRLIAVASTAGLKGYAYASAYGAAKHGVVGLVRGMAQELAKTGITTNALCPAFLDTPMTAQSVTRITQKTGRDRGEALAALVAGNPQGRLVQPAEVSAAALWLCGPGSGAVNGQAIAIDGGET